MDKNQVEAIFERMYASCGVDNDYQLAKHLGVKASSVKGWKIAKHPPYKACFEIFLRTGVTVEWLVTGQTPEQYNRLSHVAESDYPYDSASDLATTGVNQNSISMPLSEFQSLFRDAIIDGVSSQFFDLMPGTDRRAIDALASRFYRKVNDPVVLPDEVNLTGEDLPENNVS